MCVIGTILRFYNLTWGSPYYFHPDERNIASAITQLSYPMQMNPHFFAYGSLPIYIVYFVGVLANFIRNLFYHTTSVSVSFEQAILIGRFLSALLSVGLIPLLYIIGKRLAGKTAGLFAAFFATTSIGLIQYAHFSTFEIWITFFSTLLFFFLFSYSLSKKTRYVFFAAGTLGILISIKMTTLILLPFYFLCLFVLIFFQKHKPFFSKISSFFLSCFFTLIISILILFISNPIVFFDSHEFIASMQYESSVALGFLPVFYTQGFINTIPIFYQLLNIFPFILNPLLLLIFIPSFIYIIYTTIVKRSISFLLCILFFLILFSSSGFFYAKWTRYMIPTLPFIYLIVAIATADLYTFLLKKLSIGLYLSRLLVGIIFLICSFYALTFVYVVYYQKDSRIAAMKWAKENISPQTHIVSEVYDLGIVPFNHQFPSITLVNFYDLEHDTAEQEKLTALQKDASIVILPSQRILKTRINNPKAYPKGFSFYTKLFQNKTYKKIYQTPCNLFCKILYNGNPVFYLEETATVFDRPTVYIFKKI